MNLGTALSSWHLPSAVVARNDPPSIRLTIPEPSLQRMLDVPLPLNFRATPLSRRRFSDLLYPDCANLENGFQFNFGTLLGLG